VSFFPVEEEENTDEPNAAEGVLRRRSAKKENQPRCVNFFSLVTSIFFCFASFFASNAVVAKTSRTQVPFFVCFVVVVVVGSSHRPMEKQKRQQKPQQQHTEGAEAIKNTERVVF